MGVRGFAPSMVGGPCRPRSSSKIIAPNREPLVFRTNLEKVGIALLRSNGRKGRQPLQWKCAPHRPVPPSLFIQNHYAKSGALVFRNELRKRVRTSHVGGSFFVGNGVRIEALAKPIFVRGVSPFNGSAPRTLQWPARLAPLLRTGRG